MAEDQDQTDSTLDAPAGTVDDWDGVHSDRVHLVATDVTPEQIAKTLGVELPAPAAATPAAAAEVGAESPTPASVEAPEAAPEPASASQPAKKSKSPSAQIAQAQFDLREAKRQAKAALDRTRELEAQLAAAEAQKASATAPVPPMAAENVPATFPPWDTWAALPANESKTYEDYADARGDWRAQQRGLMTRDEVERLALDKARELRAQERQDEVAATEAQAAAARQVAFLTGREEAKRFHHDYAAVVEESELPTNPVMDEFILRTGERSGEIMYYLGSHPEECQRIAGLPSAAEVIKAMTRIELTLEGVSAAGPSASAPLMTRAPAPPEPVGGARHSSAAPSLADPRLSLKDFMRIRNEQEWARAAQS